MISRRFFSLGSVSFRQRHPVISTSQSAPIENHTVPLYDPEFDLNRQQAQAMEPWVPRRERRRAALNRQQRLRQQENAQKLLSMHEQLFPEDSKLKLKQMGRVSLLGGESAETQVPLHAPESHPDPSIDYQQKVEYFRQKYAQELREKQMNSGKQESKETVAQASSSTASTSAEPEETLTKEQEQIRDALQFMENICIKQWKLDKVTALESAKKQQRLEQLTRLYHQSRQFITLDSLDRAIDQCLATRDPTADGMNALQLRLFSQERRKFQREQQLADALQDTVDKRESTSTLLSMRYQEMQTLVEKQQQEDMKQSGAQ